MKRIIVLATLVAISGSAAADERVRGYFKGNGTYVQPYLKTTPNTTRLDNWTTKGNVNPYTGKTGTQPLIKPRKWP